VCGELILGMIFEGTTPAEHFFTRTNIPLASLHFTDVQSQKKITKSQKICISRESLVTLSARDPKSIFQELLTTRGPSMATTTTN
jgi:hypothetical protein